MDLTTAKGLIQYHDWATRRLFGAVASLTSEQFTRPLETSFPSIQALVGHLINAEEIWQCRLMGLPQPPLTPELLPEPAAVLERWEELQTRMQTFLAGPAPAEPIVMKSSSGREFRHTFVEILLHMNNHGSYHRGQLAIMLRQVGAQPRSTDLIHYIREQTGQLG
jgi:uncharacterized damage-inducible protein DinB